MVEGTNPARGQVAGRSTQNKPVNFTTSLPIAPGSRFVCEGENHKHFSQQPGR